METIQVTRVAELNARMLKNIVNWLRNNGVSEDVIEKIKEQVTKR